MSESICEHREFDVFRGPTAPTIISDTKPF